MGECEDNHRWYAVIARNREVLETLQWCTFNGEILSRELAIDLFGAQAVIVEALATPEEHYANLVTLDAFYAMGARVLCALPKRKRPPENNTKPSA